MVSPKIKHGKSKKIISKVARPVTEIRGHPDPGNEKAQPRMMTSKQRAWRSIEKNDLIPMPRKVGEVSTSKNCIGEIRNARDEPRVMRSNQAPELEAIQHRPGRNIEVNHLAPRPRKIGQFPTSINYIGEAGNERDQLHVMRSNQGADLEAIQYRPSQTIEVNDIVSSQLPIMRNQGTGFDARYHNPSQNSENNGLLSRHGKNVQDTRDCHDNLFFAQAATSNSLYGFEAVHNDPSQNIGNNTLLSRPRKDMQDMRDCHESLFYDRAETSKNANGFGASTNTQTSLPPNVNITGCSKPKKKRGRTKGIKLAKTLERGNKFEIIFPRHVNRPVGEYSTMFTTEIGVLVRHFAPLQAVSWVAISHEIKDSIMSRLRDKFVFSEEPRVVESIKYTMARRYNTWRYNLHDSFLKYRTMALALSNPPDGIKVEDWRYLCNLFTTPEFEARSVRNKKNRDKLRSTHIAGTKAFSKIRYDKRNPETQKELEFDELYQSTHQKDDGSWVHDNAREFHENLKKHKTNAESEGTSLTDEQFSVLTFGRKSGYVCGLGYGPKTTTSIKGKRTRADLEREAHEAVKRAELAERKAAALAERLELLEAQQADFSSKLREEMNSQFASFRQQLLGR